MGFLFNRISNTWVISNYYYLLSKFRNIYSILNISKRSKPFTGTDNNKLIRMAYNINGPWNTTMLGSGQMKKENRIFQDRNFLFWNKKRAVKVHFWMNEWIDEKKKKRGFKQNMCNSNVEVISNCCILMRSLYSKPITVTYMPRYSIQYIFVLNWNKNDRREENK